MTENTMVREIYGGELKIKFVESNHSYWVSELKDGVWSGWKRATGVTTIIGIKDKSRPLMLWALDLACNHLHLTLRAKGEITKYEIEEARVLHTQKLQEAASSGSKVHDWIEAYVKGENPPMPMDQNVLNGVNAFLEWMASQKVTILESELILYSRAHRYCGKFDAVVKIGKKRYMLDFKTSKSLHNEVRMQTAAYQMAYEEMGLGKLDGRLVVRFEKRTEEEFAEEMDRKGKPEASYVTFELRELDMDNSALADDYGAFLACQQLRDWDAKTDFWKVDRKAPAKD